MFTDFLERRAVDPEHRQMGTRIMVVYETV